MCRLDKIPDLNTNKILNRFLLVGVIIFVLGGIILVLAGWNPISNTNTIGPIHQTKLINKELNGTTIILTYDHDNCSVFYYYDTINETIDALNNTYADHIYIKDNSIISPNHSGKECNIAPTWLINYAIFLWSLGIVVIISPIVLYVGLRVCQERKKRNSLREQLLESDIYLARVG
jgi:hypothetical protein